MLPPSCFLTAVTWDINRKTEAANPRPQRPPNRLYVPLRHRGDLITWPYTSVGTGHPGSTRTTQVLSAKYCCPAMHRDVIRFIPLKGIPTALETADLLFRNVFRQFGLSKDIVSDRGAQFTSRLWKELLAKLNITVSLTSGYHPQANGQVERVNQELGKFLCLYCQ
ncbi:hypothetical protein P4O66_000395 [Electrophorus voltai]|uniref:Integrase catalytic domain-containing protein n=1 Tax=Electrophorus voltai TaxID=2609070 RepID=A0AAD8ZHI5_9TELE|nr:hypothetical protein P4O66_000395 [Electrophorus voltai]